jgi:hypothetical protein
MRKFMLFSAFFLMACAGIAFAQAAEKWTPDYIKQLFDGWSITIMFAWGLVHKYLPQLKNIPNILIPWVNLVGYVLAKFVVPDANAGILDGIPAAVGAIIGGFTNASWAMLLYEGWGRALLERLLKVKPPKPVTA